MSDIISRLIKEFKLKPFQVENTVKLIDEGSTIPFIARYRKEMTGELNDQVLRELYERLIYLRNLESRKEDVKRLIDEAGKLTGDIVVALKRAETLQEVEDIYLPYKPKRRTRAAIAREKGLEPLAGILILQVKLKGTIKDIAGPFINPEKGVESVEDALNGAMDIIAEEVSDNAEHRKTVREVFLRNGVIITKAKKEEDSVYRMYYDFKEPVDKIASHRILAINRGEKEGYLQVKIDVPDEEIITRLKRKVVKNPHSETSQYVESAVEDAYKRLIFPSMENEIRNAITETAEEQAMVVFRENLKNLLMQPPIKNKIVLGLDPAYRTGCKLAVVDGTGKVLDTAVIYPTPPQNKVEEARKVVKYLIDKHKVDIVSIGNGTASRESELFIADLLKEIDRKVHYIIVSEAGASVYSVSKAGAEEFPDFDVSQRSAVSIARRLQDPMAELVKIDPKSIGVGQYQHDMNQKRLDESLTGVVEDSVNKVGVDLNTASPSLLSYISSVNTTLARNIVGYRETNGKFKNREELKKVKRLGQKTFEQCAGFLRISEGENILDNTAVHPESYDAALKLLKAMGYSLESVKNRKLGDLKKKVEKYSEGFGIEKLAQIIGAGVPTLMDIIDELSKPGRDPRDELPKPVFHTDVMKIEDLKAGMMLTGTVRNVANFGAFVDIGVHQDGLVHISEMSDRFVRNPMDIVSVGDIVKVKVLNVDVEKKRISLSMKGIKL
ncbi:MAG TPA: Tex family protein [Clostridiales bacterium]|nr:Tex family protein [Clostridiales bacterium]